MSKEREDKNDERGSRAASVTENGESLDSKPEVTKPKPISNPYPISISLLQLNSPMGRLSVDRLGPSRPRRRLLFDLHISADNPEALIRSLRQVQYNIETGHKENKANGYSADFEYGIDDKPEITADRYVESVREFEK
jgi:hypothetical protein